MRDPECALRVIWSVFTAAFYTFYGLLLCPAFAAPPPPTFTCSSPPLLHPSHSSFLVAPPLPLCSLLYLVHLPCCTEVRVRGQLPGSTTEPVLEGVVMLLRSVLSFCFISPDNSFPQDTALHSPAALCSVHEYVCVRMCGWMLLCIFQ